MAARTLVFGATGRIGRRVVRELVAQEEKVRVFTRDLDKARRLFGCLAGVDFVQGDLAQSTTVRQAMVGVDRIFLLSGGVTCLDAANELNVVSAAQAAGVAKIVKVSGGPPITSELSDSPIGRAHWQVENALGAGDFRATILRPSLFLDLLFFRLRGSQFIDRADPPISFVDVGDIARVAVVALLSSEHEHQTYCLSGGPPVDGDQVFHAIQRAANAPLERKRIAADAVGEHVPEWYRPHVAAVLRCTARGEYGRVTDVVRRVTGRLPLTFDEFVERESTTFHQLACAPPLAHDALRTLVDDR